MEVYKLLSTDRIDMKDGLYSTFAVSKMEYFTGRINRRLPGHGPMACIDNLKDALVYAKFGFQVWKCKGKVSHAKYLWQLIDGRVDYCKNPVGHSSHPSGMILMDTLTLIERVK